MPHFLLPSKMPSVSDVLDLLTKIADIFRPEERLKVEWTSPDYEKRSFLWGMYFYERGERRTLMVEGKSGTCVAKLRELSASGTIQHIGGFPRAKALRRFIGDWSADGRQG